MKSLAIACAVLVAAVSSAKAADVSKGTLEAMGFGSAKIMSDNDGLAIRGKGTYAGVWGTSSAAYGDHTGASSASNSYKAGAHHKYGSALAKGDSDSFAGRVNEVTKTFGPFSKTFTHSTMVISGGSAFAFAK
jgi:hypothetical protein